MSICLGTYEGTLYLWRGHSENLGINGGDELNWQADSDWQRRNVAGFLWHIGPYELELITSTNSKWENVHSGTPRTFRQFQWSTSRNDCRFVCVPQWFAILCIAFAAALPWLQNFTRFSLRNLLIALTLVSVAMGMVAYTMQ